MAKAKYAAPDPTISLQQVDPNLYAAQQANPTADADGSNTAATDASQQATLTAAASALDNSNPSGVPAGAATSPQASQPAAPVSQAPSDQSTITSASSVITSALNGVGLGGMAAWATSTITTLAGQGMDPTSIENYILTNLNNPLDANGSVDTAALDAFNTALPGFNTRISNGYGNGDPGDTSPLGAIGAYLTYASQIQSMAQSAGLTPGTIGSSEIGTLWAGDVSSTEVSTRITQGIVDVQQLTNNLPGFSDFMSSNYGITQGDLVSYYLNPTNTMQTLQNQINTGTVASESSTTGFGSISASQAQALGAFLASSNSSGMGGIGNVAETAANNAFTSSLGSDNAGASMGSAAQMANAGYLVPLPGQNGTLTQDDLLGAIEGQSGDLQNASQATQGRKAGGQGGGGFAQTSQGAEGFGFANG